jgi:hypothetical protein
MQSTFRIDVHTKLLKQKLLKKFSPELGPQLFENLWQSSLHSHSKREEDQARALRKEINFCGVQ